MFNKKDFTKNNIYYSNNKGILYLGDCVDKLKTFKDEVVDLTVTSPPYDDLRTYETEDINKVWNFKKFKIFAREIFRVTKKGGVLVWVVGDSTVKGSETGNSFRQALFFKKVGFNLHDTMIYLKHGFAHPDSTRYHQVFEYMFVLSKGKPKTFNPLKDKKNKYAGQTCWGKNTYRNKDGTLLARKKKIIQEYGVRTNVWKYVVSYGFGQKDKIAYKHPATFPEQLAIDHIKSWSNKDDLVMDPFAGSGTTLKAAQYLGRNWIGIEINKKYCKIIKQRLINILDI